MNFCCPHCNAPLALGLFPRAGGLVVCMFCLGFCVIDAEWDIPVQILILPRPPEMRLILRAVSAHELGRVAVRAKPGKVTTADLTVEDLLVETRNQRLWCQLGHPKPRRMVQA